MVTSTTSRYTVTYYKREATAHDKLSFSSPEYGNLELINQLPAQASEELIDYLKENDEEFNSCVELSIIIIKENASTDESGGDVGVTDTTTILTDSTVTPDATTPKTVTATTRRATVKP